MLVLSLGATARSCRSRPVGDSGDSASLVQQTLALTSVSSEGDKSEVPVTKRHKGRASKSVTSEEEEEPTAPVTKKHQRWALKSVTSEEDETAALDVKKQSRELVSKLVQVPSKENSNNPTDVGGLVDGKKSSSKPVDIFGLVNGMMALGRSVPNMSNPTDVGEALVGLSKVFKAAGIPEAASEIKNASIVVPPLMSAATKVSELAEEVWKKIMPVLGPAMKQLHKDVEPHEEKLDAEMEKAIKRAFTGATPHLKALASTMTDALNVTVKNFSTRFQGPEFASLRTAVKKLAGTDI